MTYRFMGHTFQFGFERRLLRRRVDFADHTIGPMAGAAM